MEKQSFLKSAAILMKSRGDATFVWTWQTAAASLISTRGFPKPFPFLITLASVFFIANSVYIYNDIADRELDKINEIKKHRPLPSGKVPVDHAEKLVYIFVPLGFTMIFFVNIYSFIFGLIYFTLFTTYSYPKIHLKRRFLVKESILTSGIFFVSLIGSYAVKGYYTTNVLYASIVVSIFGFVVQPAMIDTLDIEADKMQGVKNLAIVLSWRRKMQLILIGIFILMTVTPLTYVNFGFNMILPIFTVAGCIIVLRYLFPILNVFEKTLVLKARKSIIVYYILLQMFMIIGSLNIEFFF